MKTYFAILHKDAESAVGVVFPDLPGCFSAGDSYEDAIRNAETALALYAEAELSAGRALPEPRSFDRIYAEREVRDETHDAPFVGIRLTERSLHRSGVSRQRESGELVAGSGSDQTSSTARKPRTRSAKGA